MDKLIIKGGRPLEGTVSVSGAKNAALPILCATLLTDQPCEIANVPPLRDVNTLLQLLSLQGSMWQWERPEALSLHCPEIKGYEAPYDLVKTMRASVLVLGPLLARTGQARISLPGGCAIGERPIDQHLKALERLGAEITMERGYVLAKADKLTGAEIRFDVPSVTGTENAMMAAALAEGETVIANAAREPEVSDLAEALNAMGARIEGIGEDHLVIQGVSSLGALKWNVIPDRIEAGTYMAAVATAGGRITLQGARADHLEACLDKLREAGCEIDSGPHAITIGRSQPLEAVDISTQPHPGFPTDLQAQFMAAMCTARGASIIRETIFENRYMHVPELRRMGADITLDGHTAIIKGRERLFGAPLMATDLRASASLVLAGLGAEGVTEVHRIYHLDRGYVRMEEKLARLGADIRREVGP